VIPLTSQGQPPSHFELLQEAVLTLKEVGTGASLPEIQRQLQRRYKGRFDKARRRRQRMEGRRPVHLCPTSTSARCCATS
jgi:hypothetical protein